MLRRHRVIGVLVGLGLAAAPAWAEVEPRPAGDAAAPSAPAAQEWMGPPRPAPAGIDPNATAISGEDPVRAALWRAWAIPDELGARALRLQRAGLSAGIGNLDAPARALLLDASLGDPLERAGLAVELAPALPAAHAALAVERFERWQLFGAMSAMQAAAEAAPEHLEARLWLEATALDVLFGACFGAALGFLGLVALAAFPRFARDLRRLRELPAPSAGALAAAIVLLPVAMGEGLAGLGLGLVAFALVNGTGWRRLWVLSAGALMLLALFPLLERRAESHAAPVLDPVALAAWATEQGTPTSVELARVVRAADHDFLASRALALRLARQGELSEAEWRFMRLLEQDESPDLVANTAAVRLLRGDVEGSIAFYEKASRSSRSAVIRFDLAQAYGRAIRLDIQDLALAEAQSIDPDVLSKLNHRYNGEDGAFVAYLPLPVGPVLERLHDPAATAALARAFRQRLAPGVLGESRGDAVVALWLAAAAGLLFGVALQRWVGPEEDLYAGIARLLQTRGGDSMERMEKLQELRLRQRRVERAAGLLAWLVPGAAGMVAKRPLLSLLSVVVLRHRRVALAPSPRGRTGSAGARRAARRAGRARDVGRRARLSHAAAGGALAPGEEVNMSVALHGNLRDFGIGEVFQLIGQQRKTGVLEVDATRRCASTSRFDERRGDLGDRVGASRAGRARRHARAHRPAHAAAPGRARASDRGARGAARGAAARERGDPRRATRRDRARSSRARRCSSCCAGRAARSTSPRGPVVARARLVALLPAEQMLMDGLRMVDEWRSFDEARWTPRRSSRRPGASRSSAAPRPARAARARRWPSGSSCWSTGASPCAASSTSRASAASRARAGSPASGAPARSSASTRSWWRRSTARRRQGLELSHARSLFGAAFALLPWLLLAVVVFGVAQNRAPRPERAESLSHQAFAAPGAGLVRDAAPAQPRRRLPLARGEWPAGWPNSGPSIARRAAPSPWRRSTPANTMSRSAATASWSSRPRTEDREEKPHLPEPEASTRQTLVFDDNELAAALYGERERTLRIDRAGARRRRRVRAATRCA